jgi:hypothetical protein
LSVSPFQDQGAWEGGERAEIKELTITIDLMHVLLGNPTDDTLLHNAFILPDNLLHELQLFHRNLSEESSNQL